LSVSGQSYDRFRAQLRGEIHQTPVNYAAFPNPNITRALKKNDFLKLARSLH